MAITLAQAQAKLALWLAAEDAVAGGQSYSIGGRSLSRVDVAKIAERITHWNREVDRLTAGRSGLRVQRVVPRD